MWGGVEISPQSRREALYIVQDLRDRTRADFIQSSEAELLRRAQIVVIDAAGKKDHRGASLHPPS